MNKKEFRDQLSVLLTTNPVRKKEIEYPNYHNGTTKCTMTVWEKDGYYFCLFGDMTHKYGGTSITNQSERVVEVAKRTDFHRVHPDRIIWAEYYPNHAPDDYIDEIHPTFDFIEDTVHVPRVSWSRLFSVNPIHG